MTPVSDRPQRLVILGTRVFAEEVADLVSDCGEYEVAAFGENWERERCGAPLLGLPIVWVDELRPLAATHLAVCALYTTRRRVFVDQAQEMGFKFATVRHPTARVSSTSSIGVGSIVSVGVAIGAHTVLGVMSTLGRERGSTLVPLWT